MGDIRPFQRRSLTDLLRDLEEQGPNARGIIGVWLTKDGHGHFHISGFNANGYGDLFTVCGLLDWIKADLLKDIT